MKVQTSRLILLYFPFNLYQVLILGCIIKRKGKMRCSLMIKSKARITAIGTYFAASYCFFGNLMHN